MTVHEATGEVVETGLVVRPSIVTPAVSATDALQAWESYEELKKKIAKPEDYQKIQGKDFPKKSLWRKLATFFNLSVDCVSEREIKNEDGSIDFDLVYKATAPNGRFSIGDGSCNSQEKTDRSGNPIPNSRHNTRGIAHTRAFNRAVSNLIGGGEVSADEIRPEDVDDPIPFTHIFLLLEQLEKPLDSPETWARFAQITGKSSLGHWTLEEGLKVERALLAALKQKQSSEVK